MKILVPIKRVIDAYVNIRVKSDNSGVETNNVKMSINPFDEIAVEEAVRLKEQGKASEIIVVSIDARQAQETLRTALALGADRGILVATETEIQPLGIASILQALVKKEEPHLVLMGKQAIDDDNNQTGQMLAGLLNWSQGTFTSKLILEETHATVTREIDGGLETLKLTLPSVVTTDLRLNEPRYASLPNIMKAKRKPLDSLSVDDLGISINQHYTQKQVTPPAERKAGIKVANVEELVDKLKNEAKVIE